MSVSCSLVVTCCKRADLLALLYVMFSCDPVTFPYNVLGQVWYLIVLIPDLFLPSNFHISLKEALDPWLPIERPSKNLIRLCTCRQILPDNCLTLGCCSKILNFRNSHLKTCNMPAKLCNFKFK